jgi:MYXO-CTERM domain-containing protein
MLLFRRSLVVLAGLLPLPAAAASIVAYSNDFDAYTTSSFSGTDGWVSSYASDTWSAYAYGTVYARTDDSGGTWGSGGAIDDHLVYTSESWSDFTYDVNVYSSDNDAIGVVFRYADSRNFYLLAMGGGDDGPATGSGGSTIPFSGTHLYRVSGGTATDLGSSSTSYTAYRTQALEIVASGSSIAVWFDADDDGSFSASENLLNVTDTTFDTGNIGFWCYDNGNGTGGCAFDDVVVSIPDSDGDGVADVDDDCPSDADASQTDTDGDGLGDACDDDLDGDGYVSTAVGGTDCDDADATVSPAGTESCATAADDDCDGTTNDIGATGCSTFYADGDADGYGTGAGECVCVATSSFPATNASDCDDAAASVNPGAPEVCDDIDDDCDGAVDEDATDAVTWYPDADGDGYGDGSLGFDACDGGVSDGTDCDDTRADVYPGAPELPDRLDNDCDGVADEDLDTDGDGLTDDVEEYDTHTDPYAADTDGGGVSDGDEVAGGTDPLDPSDDPVPVDTGGDSGDTGSDTGSGDTGSGDSGDSGDSGHDTGSGDSGRDTGSGDSGVPDSGDSPGDSGLPDDTGAVGRVGGFYGAGCATAPGSGGVVAVAALVALVARRRR